MNDVYSNIEDSNILLKIISKELFHGDFNIYFTDLSLKFTGIRRKFHWMGIMSTL